MKEVEKGHACSAYSGEEKGYRVLVEKSEGKRLLGRPRSILENNIKLDPKEIQHDV